jgi:putative endonuclease
MSAQLAQWTIRTHLPAGQHRRSRGPSRPTVSQYYVYILASLSRTLYVGMTNDLARRLYEHRNQPAPRSFSSRYRAHRLVYFEVAASAYAAITREKQIKGWLREKKVELIERENPGWEDLAVGLGLVDEQP